MGRYILAFTGASGAVVGIRLLEELVSRENSVIVLSTDAGKIVLSRELNIDIASDEDAHARLVRSLRERGAPETVERLITYYPAADISAAIASGSCHVDGMMVVPCSMSSLSGIACGRSANLIERAADVCIKEGRTLLLSPRELPFSSIHLENMLKLSRAGVIIAPPVPAFYHGPETIEDLIDFIVGKILSRMGIEHRLFSPWQG